MDTSSSTLVLSGMAVASAVGCSVDAAVGADKIVGSRTSGARIGSAVTVGERTEVTVEAGTRVGETAAGAAGDLAPGLMSVAEGERWTAGWEVGVEPPQLASNSTPARTATKDNVTDALMTRALSLRRRQAIGFYS